MTGTAVASTLTIDLSNFTGNGKDLRRTCLSRILDGSDASQVEILVPTGCRQALDDDRGIRSWIANNIVKPKDPTSPFTVTPLSDTTVKFTIPVKPGSLRLPDGGEHLRHPGERQPVDAPQGL